MGFTKKAERRRTMTFDDRPIPHHCRALLQMLSSPPGACDVAEWTDDEPDEVELSHQIMRRSTWKATPIDEDSGDASEMWKEGFGTSSADGPTLHMKDTTELTRTQLEYLRPVAVARSGYAAGFKSQKPHIMEVFCSPRFS